MLHFYANSKKYQTLVPNGFAMEGASISIPNGFAMEGVSIKNILTNSTILPC